ncbi:MAG: monovalent cation/H+ antiporter subunit D family protein [Pseudomonadota bacterium]
MIAAQLPILEVVLPLIAAPVCVLLRRGNWAWLLAVAVSWLSFIIAIALLAQVSDGQIISYALGGWLPPLGIEYRVDAANALVLMIVSGIGALVLPYARASVEEEIPEQHHSLFYTCFLLCLSGLLGVTITGDAFNLFVFLEISSLSTYILVAMGASRDRRALSAAYTYLIMGTVGATFFVIGVGLIYAVTGSLNMVDIAQRLAEVGDLRTVRVAYGFIVVGIGLKLAMFPMHLWLPNAYTYAPSVVTAFLAATATKVAVYALLRFMFTVFGVGFGQTVETLVIIFLPLALIAMFAGSTVAIFQINIKRLLAYSSIAQIGYMLLGVSFASITGLTATLLHLFNHALMKGALFMALGCVMLRLGDVSIQAMAGLGRRMPWTMAAFVAGGLSLIGVPATVGFISKWYLIQAALERGWWPVAILIVLSSLLAVIYIWRLVEVAYFRAPTKGPARCEAPLSMLVPLWLIVGANIYFGIDADLTVSVARLAAGELFAGVAP